MRYIIVLLIIAFAAVGTAVALRDDAGYVLLSYGGWSAELSLASFVLLLLLTLIVLGIALKFLLWVWRLPHRLAVLRRQRTQQKARRNLVTGITDMAEGRFREGEKRLLNRATRSETPLVHYLLAARAAQKQDAHERRDDYLRLAYEHTPAATVPVLLTQAELQIAHEQYEHAQATLKRLQEIKPGHAYGLNLLARLNLALSDWDGLEELLPRLRKSPAMPSDEVEALEIKVLAARLAQLARPGQEQALKFLWQSIPRRLRAQLVLIRAYVQALLAADAQDTAEGVIRDSLKSQWDEQLILAYGDTLPANSKTPAAKARLEKQLARSEQWLKNHGDSAAALLTAGRLCAALQLWGKATDYLLASIDRQPRAQAYAALGTVYQATGQIADAMQAYQAGLLLEIKGQVKPLKKPNKRGQGENRIA
ncbi:MAG TPA: heme biosynthesis HemY N-terminal domain-containing protein [Gammaproteobacteria bacterium]|nr:heme biosynthesis HemY N-terminal domain-containing protein [Gammaproteobacteria bacterium]